MDHSRLIKAAHKAKKHSHSPYSRFRVGAALLADNGKIFTGCNIENSSFSLTICAERTALFKAVSEGLRKFKALAIASDVDSFVSPCGACRQVIMDLAGDIDIILTDSKGNSKIIKISALLPLPFDSSILSKL